jgi:hypothetical protein
VSHAATCCTPFTLTVGEVEPSSFTLAGSARPARLHANEQRLLHHHLRTEELLNISED